MTVYVYAIVEAAGPELPDVRVLARGDVAAAFRPVDEAPAATAEEMLAHERVVEELMRRRAVLPARFGTTLPDEDALAALLDRDGAMFGELLARVRGCVEVSVRVRWDAPDDGRRRALELVRPLAGLARDSTASAPADDVLAAAYLVAEEDVRPFAAEVRRLQDADAGLDLSCTGPWPPYSFVGAS